MLSPGERAIIKAEIERLQKAHKECRDDGIREKIDAWIVEQKQKLASGDYSPCPICGKPCPPEDLRHCTGPLHAQKVLPRLQNLSAVIGHPPREARSPYWG